MFPLSHRQTQHNSGDTPTSSVPPQREMVIRSWGNTFFFFDLGMIMCFSSRNKHPLGLNSQELWQNTGLVVCKDLSKWPCTRLFFLMNYWWFLSRDWCLFTGMTQLLIIIWNLVFIWRLCLSALLINYSTKLCRNKFIFNVFKQKQLMVPFKTRNT